MGMSGERALQRLAAVPVAGTPMPPETDIIFVASAGHSGSTLLDLLIGNHEDVSGVGELNRLSLHADNRVCACGQVVAQCPYWQRIREALTQVLGRETLIQWDECHTDIPPLERLFALDDVRESDWAEGAAPPRDVRDGFAARGVKLSPNTRMARGGGDRDIKWNLIDPDSDTRYVLRREHDRIVVYPRLREWRNPLRRLPDPLEVMLTLGSPWGLRTLAAVSAHAQLAIDTARNSWLVADTVALSDGTRYVVDSSKTAVRLKLMYLQRPARVRIINLVRDGRAVAASAMRRRGVAASTAARIWKRENQHLHLVLRTVPADSVLRLRYEALCDSPQQEMDRVWKFLGLAPREGLVELWNRPVHNIPGNPMLFERSRRTISKDERWRRDLSPAELTAFEQVAGRFNRNLGYL